MLYYALVFFVIAVIAGLLGFGVIATAAAGVAKILFWIFLVVFLVAACSEPPMTPLSNVETTVVASRRDHDTESALARNPRPVALPP